MTFAHGRIVKQRKTTETIMKTTLLILAAATLILPCCTTETTTHPDGSITKTSRLDSAAITAGGTVVQKVVPIFYDPRTPVTGAKGAVEVQPEADSEFSWLSAGMSLLGF